MGRANNVEVLGEAIAKALAKKEWSQADLANELGVYQQTVSKWIRGQAAPGIPTLLLTEKVLGLKKGRLVGLLLPEDAQPGVKRWSVPRSMSERLNDLEVRFNQIEKAIARLGGK